VGAESLGPSPYNTQNLRGQSLVFLCLGTGFATTAPALARYQQGRGINPLRRELVGIPQAPKVEAVPESAEGGVPL